MTYAVETDHLVKSYKGFKAVDGLSLRVPKGSIYGFLGPNGAGKTTTIKMLTGLTTADSGSIRICGREVVFGSLEGRKAIGFLPDVPSFYDWMNAAEYMRLSGKLLGLDGKQLESGISELLDLVGLTGVKKKIGGFSRGMKQRLGIAQALIGNPEVVFLDEPTSALDPIGRKEIMDIIARLSGKVTVFFSTHILSDVERICDRVVILNRGKAMLEDSMENLKSRFSTKAVVLDLFNEDKKPRLLEMLEKCPWYEKSAGAESGTLTVYLKNERQAAVELPGILAAASTGLNRLVPVEPDLEEIFMKVVEKQ